MAKRVDVGKHTVVKRELDFIESERRLAGDRIDPAHPVIERTEGLTVHGALLEHEMLQGHGFADFHQRGRLHGLLRRDQVERAALVVGTPAAPVGKFLLPFGQRFQRNQPFGVLGRRVRLEFLRRDVNAG